MLATLNNQGEINPPHSNPSPNPFGINARNEYYYMRDLLEYKKRRNYEKVC